MVLGPGTEFLVLKVQDMKDVQKCTKNLYQGLETRCHSHRVPSELSMSHCRRCGPKFPGQCFSTCSLPTMTKKPRSSNQRLFSVKVRNHDDIPYCVCNNTPLHEHRVELLHKSLHLKGKVTSVPRSDGPSIIAAMRQRPRHLT